MFPDRIAVHTGITAYVKSCCVGSTKKPIYKDNSQALILISLVYCYEFGHCKAIIAITLHVMQEAKRVGALLGMRAGNFLTGSSAVFCPLRKPSPKPTH
jgi:hypothetical protein